LEVLFAHSTAEQGGDNDFLGNPYFLESHQQIIRSVVLNIASKLFHETKPKEAQSQSQEVPLSQSKPSGFYSCTVHKERPPMTYSEFENHQEIYRPKSWWTCKPISIPQGDERLRLVPSYSSDDIVGQCRKCKSPGFVSRMLFESAFQDLNSFPLTLQGDCPKCGAKIIFLQELQAVCEYCKTPQAKRGQTRCNVCGAHYPI
jgi:hypothetical protein